MIARNNVEIMLKISDQLKESFGSFRIGVAL